MFYLWVVREKDRPAFRLLFVELIAQQSFATPRPCFYCQSGACGRGAAGLALGFQAAQSGGFWTVRFIDCGRDPVAANRSSGPGLVRLASLSP